MRREHLFIVIAALFYGTVIAGGEFFLQRGFSLFEIALFPILLMTLTLGPIVILKPQYSIRAVSIRFFVVYGFIGALAEFGQFVGLIFGVPVAVVALVLYTQPLWTVLLSSTLLEESITGRKIIAASLGVAGVAVLLLGSWTLRVAHPITGLLVCLIGSVFISLWVIWGRKSGINKLHFVTTTFGWGAFTTLWLIMLWPILRLVVSNPTVSRLSVDFPIKYWLYLTLFAMGGGIVPSFCFFKGLRSVQASVAGVILLLEPVSAAFLAALVFGQSLDTKTVVGGALILLSNYVISGESQPVETDTSTLADQGD